MALSKKYKFILAAFLLILLSFTGAFAGADTSEAKEKVIELFVFAPCESCNEEEKFSKEVEHKLAEAGEGSYECRVYNAYKDSGASRLEALTEDYGLDISISDLPAAIVQGETFFGTYDEIGEALGEYLENRAEADEEKSGPGTETDNSADVDLGAGRGTDSDIDTERSVDTVDVANENAVDSVFCRDIMDVGKDDTVLILFVTGSCDSCNEAEEYLKNYLPKEHCKLHIYNIMEDENAAVIRKLMGIYEVPDNKQQVPLLFFKDGFLSGADAIRENTLGRLQNTDASGPWEAVAKNFSGENDDLKFSKLKLAVTGFANGLNPCGISMLLMVLSMLLVSGKNFFKGSFSYLAGKFLTYLCLGFTIGKLLVVIEGRAFKTVHGTLNIIFAVLALGLSLFYFMDFIHVMGKDYGKERLRLPEKLRKWNHEKIKKLTDVQGWLLFPVLFLLGIVISAGEFLCTGQVYLATLLYMAGRSGAMDGELVGNLLIYLTAMCVPMVLLTLLVAKGKNIMSASHFSLKLLPFIKLTYSLFFFILCVSLLV
ncbi:MAG: hypothetical protein IJJ64_10030 [Butyrivibrio sp.]|nr:hypothetical protein [Butyrivibrio sp.]